MPSRHSPSPARSSLIQFVVSFGIPTIVLLFFSGSSRLGPLGAMLFALAFPIGLELYSLVRKRKPSVVSLVSITGIVLIGLISLLGLSEEWLAVRRSALYAVGAIGLLLVITFKPQWIEKGMDRILEMEGVRRASRRNKTEAQLLRSTRMAGYALVVVLAVVAIASYILTIVFISAPTGSSEFNTQYAELRILSLLVITVPFMIAVTSILVYVVGKFEKLSGISAENLIKKQNHTS